MITEFLTDEHAQHAKSVWGAIPHDSDEAFIRFWDEQTVQIDGDMKLHELKALVELLEAFAESNSSPTT